jgi:hypothetical protein
MRPLDGDHCVQLVRLPHAAAHASANDDAHFLADLAADPWPHVSADRSAYGSAHSSANGRANGRANGCADKCAGGLRGVELERIFKVLAAVRRRSDGAQPHHHATQEWRLV